MPLEAFMEGKMDIVVNGEIDRNTYRNAFDPPERAIILTNITIEFSRTPDGGWRETNTSHKPPNGGSGAGHKLQDLAKHHPWIVEQLWRRIIELEDERRILRKAISYKE